MKEIVLTKGYKTIVDDDDYERLNQYNWCYAYGYAVRSGKKSKEKREPLKFMHHEVLERKDGYVIDHANRNTLDNRKQNLRYADMSQNKANSRLRHGRSKSGYTGVYYVKRLDKYRARYQAYGKRKCLGYYATAEEAAKVYDKAMIKAFGDYAVTNIMQKI